MEKKRSIILLIIVAVLALILSISFLASSFYATYAETESEHGAHLLDLAVSTDRSISRFLRDCRKEIVGTAALLKEAEKSYRKTGSMRQIEARLTGLLGGENEFASKLAVLQDDDVLFCTHCGENVGYDFPYGIDLEQPCLCVCDDGEYYIAFAQKSGITGLTYVELVELKEFYSHVVGKELTSDYWLVLYNRDMKFYLQNDVDQPNAQVIEPDSAADRNDGISILQKSENSGEIITESYQYIKEKMNCLIVAIPTAKGENGVFSIGVAVDNLGYLARLRHLFWEALLSGIMIVFFFAVVWFLIAKLVKQEKAVRDQNKALEEDNQSLNALVEEQKGLMHRQRLEILGTLTSGIAHEFNNLLTPIMGYSVLSLQELDDEKDVTLKENLTEIYEASEKAKSLVSRICNLARKNDEAANRVVSPARVAEKVLETVMPSVPEGITVEKQFGCDEECIFVNEVQIGQLLLNIAVNAIHAMQEKGGVLTLQTRQNGENVEFITSDTGSGIPEDVLPHIFEPFFTTKGVGRGTGLGLAIVKQIADEHHGTIEVRSEVGVGTTFTLSLPVNRGGGRRMNIE